MCFFYFLGFKCPVCSKFVPSDEMDLHLVMCLTKPRITYNGKSGALNYLRFYEFYVSGKI